MTEFVEVGDDEEWLRACLEVIRAAFATVADEFGFTERSAPTNAAFWDLVRLRAEGTRGARLFALLIDGSVVGCVSLRPSSAAGALELERLAVSPRHRHRGYGRALLDHAFAAAAAAGAVQVRIGIIAENERLDRWYRGYGFRPTGTRRFDHLPFGVSYLQIAVATAGFDEPGVSAR